jgi:hypothetical protein
MSDHIPDVTKMISDTPRTDEQINGKPCTRFEILAGDCLRNAAVPSEFARQLERELNAANAIIRQQQLLDEENLRLQERIKRLEATTNDPHALWANWLRGSVTLPVGIGDVRQYQDHIRRLEEAGDALANTQTYDLLETVNWRKAKEAKP